MDITTMKNKYEALNDVTEKYRGYVKEGKEQELEPKDDEMYLDLVNSFIEYLVSTGEINLMKQVAGYWRSYTVWTMKTIEDYLYN